MAQLLKYLLGKHEDLLAVYRNHIKRSGMAADACHPGTGKVETGFLGLAGQPAWPNQHTSAQEEATQS